MALDKTNKERFLRCVDFVCGASIEGGYSDNPNDPGGPTNHGITLATLSHWRGHLCTADDVKQLSLSEAYSIYHSNYWSAVHGNELPVGVDLVVFDTAVNQGPSKAIRFLQTAVGVTADGLYGPKTEMHVDMKAPMATVSGIEAQRWASYQSNPNFFRFGRGWENRLKQVVDQAEAWING